MANVVTEGVSGMWHHHLSPEEAPYVALCGARVMRTGIDLLDWSKPYGEHFPKRPTWCADCERLARLGAR